MYTPIDDKYLEAKKNDYDKLIEYLRTYYTIDILKYEEEFRCIHTYCWIIMLWLIEFKKNGIEDKFLNDIFTNMIATIHSLIHRDMKICNFLLRNSIENFIRFFKNYIKEIEIEDSTDSIFIAIFSKLENKSLAHSKFEILKSIYSECCLYVHSALLKDDNLCDCLISYDNYYNDKEFERFTNNCRNTYLTINSLLIFYNSKVFDNMSYNNQITIRHYCIKEDLKLILELWSR